MARREIGTRWDRENRNNINENFKELYDVQNRAIEEATQAVIDSAKLLWLEPVNTFTDIATTYPNPEVGHTVFVRDTGKVYRFYDGAWMEIQQIDAGPVNEVDTRLSAEIEENRQEIEQARTKADGTTFPVLRDRLNDVDDKIGILFKRAKGISPYEFGAIGDGVADDTVPYINALDYAKTNKVPLILDGIFKIIGGVTCASYELEGVMIISKNAVINAESLTGDNVVMQLGSNSSVHGHLTINVTDTTGNGNGFVRLPICIGRWWNPSYEVKNVYIESVELSNSYNESNLIAIGGNVSNVQIENIIGRGTFSRALMIHWSGLPNNINPTITYHPNNIKIGNIKADGADESIVALSACYNVSIENITGNNNYIGLLIIAGDFGDYYANSAQKGLVGQGIVINNLSGTDFRYAAIIITGKAALIEYVINIPVVINGGKCLGKTGSYNGVEITKSSGGKISNFTVSNFGNHGVLLGDGCEGWEFDNVTATNNQQNGFRISVASGSISDIVLRKCVCKNNNKSLTSGVSEILIGNNAKRIIILEPRIQTDNTATHGITVEGSATDCIVEGGYATGFSGYRFAYRSHTPPDNNNLFKDNGGDNAANLYSDNGNPILIQKLGYGMRRFSFSRIPTSGTYYQGDEVIYTNPVAGGKRGAVCVVAGTPGTWKQFGAIDA